MSKKKPTIRQKKAIEKVMEGRGKVSVSKAMREANYSPKTAKNPKNLTESKAWIEIMEKGLPDEELMEVHRGLLKSTRIEHMIFPLKIKDNEIRKLLESVNCVARKIMHGDQAIHCWFWAPNDKARNDALEKAYKLKRKYTFEKPPEEEVKVGIQDLKDFIKWRKTKKNPKS